MCFIDGKLVYFHPKCSMDGFSSSSKRFDVELFWNSCEVPNGHGNWIGISKHNSLANSMYLKLNLPLTNVNFHLILMRFEMWLMSSIWYFCNWQWVLTVYHDDSRLTNRNSIDSVAFPKSLWKWAGLLVVKLVAIWICSMKSWLRASSWYTQNAAWKMSLNSMWYFLLGNAIKTNELKNPQNLTFQLQTEKPLLN